MYYIDIIHLENKERNTSKTLNNQVFNICLKPIKGNFLNFENLKKFQNTKSYSSFHDIRVVSMSIQP